MARKRLHLRIEIDNAQRAHLCQANAKHQLAKGDRRLKVRNGRSWDHYCVDCATTMLSESITSLDEVRRTLKS